MVCLFGLPRDYLATVLAHEAGHVYMARANFPDLNDSAREGLCELFAFLWLQQPDADALAGAPSDRRYRVHCIENNEHKIYSDGFRSALAAYQGTGSSLSTLLEQVVAVGGLPCTATGGKVASPVTPPPRQQRRPIV